MVLSWISDPLDRDLADFDYLSHLDPNDRIDRFIKFALQEIDRNGDLKKAEDSVRKALEGKTEPTQGQKAYAQMLMAVFLYRNSISHTLLGIPDLNVLDREAYLIGNLFESYIEQCDDRVAITRCVLDMSRAFLKLGQPLLAFGSAGILLENCATTVRDRLAACVLQFAICCEWFLMGADKLVEPVTGDDELGDLASHIREVFNLCLKAALNVELSSFWFDEDVDLREKFIRLRADFVETVSFIRHALPNIPQDFFCFEDKKTFDALSSTAIRSFAMTESVDGTTLLDGAAESQDAAQTPARETVTLIDGVPSRELPTEKRFAVYQELRDQVRVDRGVGAVALDETDEVIEEALLSGKEDLSFSKYEKFRNLAARKLKLRPKTPRLTATECIEQVITPLANELFGDAVKGKTIDADVLTKNFKRQAEKSIGEEAVTTVEERKRIKKLINAWIDNDELGAAKYEGNDVGSVGFNSRDGVVFNLKGKAEKPQTKYFPEITLEPQYRG